MSNNTLILILLSRENRSTTYLNKHTIFYLHLVLLCAIELLFFHFNTNSDISSSLLTQNNFEDGEVNAKVPCYLVLQSYRYKQIYAIIS